MRPSQRPLNFTTVVFISYTQPPCRPIGVAPSSLTHSRSSLRPSPSLDALFFTLKSPDPTTSPTAFCAARLICQNTLCELFIRHRVYRLAFELRPVCRLPASAHDSEIARHSSGYCAQAAIGLEFDWIARKHLIQGLSGTTSRFGADEHDSRRSELTCLAIVTCT